MKTLNFYSTSEIADLAWPEETEHLSLHSLAMDFFTDFNRTEPLIIESTISALEIKQLMQKEHTDMKLVIDAKGHFIGIITRDDLIERKFMQKISKGITIEDVSVTDLMTPKRDLLALDFEEVSKSSIADIIAFLKQNGKQHTLVIDHDTHKIRGIFSARDISEKLHQPIDVQDRESFYRLFSAIA